MFSGKGLPAGTEPRYRYEEEYDGSRDSTSGTPLRLAQSGCENGRCCHPAAADSGIRFWREPGQPCQYMNGNTATNGGHMETFKYLLKRGTKVTTALNGSTLLMEAVDKDRLDFVDFLLARAETLSIDIHHRDSEGNNVLFYAAAGGSLAMTRRLLEAGCLVESDAHGRTILMQAALHGHAALADFLVNNGQVLGVDVHQRDKDGRNALFYCVEGGHVHVLELLVRHGVVPEADGGGRTNLMQASRAGRERVVEYLLSHSGTLAIDINAKDHNGENALFYATRGRRLAVIVALLQAGVKVANNHNGINVLSQSMSEGLDAIVNALLTHAAGGLSRGVVAGRDTKGRTVLHHYVERGDLEMLHRLSQYYDPENDRDLLGTTLLMVACKHFDYMHIVRYLVEQLLVDVHKADFRNRSAIYYAVECSNLDAVKYLLEHVDKKIESDRDGLSPLMIATASGDQYVVETLLAAKWGRDLVNKDDRRGRNEVHYCAIHGYTPLLELLIHYGSKLDTQDSDGKTPIMYACANGRAHILLSLLRKGADLDLLDNRKRNALHYCFGANPSLTCVKILVRYMVETNQRDVEGLTPLMLACQTCAKMNIPIVRYVVEHGADPVTQDNQGMDAFDHCPFDAEYVKAIMRDKGEVPGSQREALYRYKDRFHQDLELNSVLRGLIRERIFTKTLSFEVMKKSASERVERLLDILCRRGNEAFRAFCRVLKDEGDVELAYSLQKEAYKKEEEIFW